MTRHRIDALVSHIGPLLGASLFTLEDRLLYSTWCRPGVSWDAELGAARWGDVVRSVFAARGHLEGSEQLDQLTVESEDSLTIVRPVNDAVAAVFLFEARTPLGLARFHIARIRVGLEELVANVAPVGQPRSRRTQVPPAFKPGAAARAPSSAPPPPPLPRAAGSRPPPAPAGAAGAQPALRTVVADGAPTHAPPYPQRRTEPPPPPSTTDYAAAAKPTATGTVPPPPAPTTEPPPPSTSEYGTAATGTEPPPFGRDEAATQDEERQSTGTEPPPPPLPRADAELTVTPAAASVGAERGDIPEPSPVESGRIFDEDTLEAAEGEAQVTTTRRDRDMPAGEPHAATTRRHRTLASGQAPFSGSSTESTDEVDAPSEPAGDTELDDAAARAASREADEDAARGAVLLAHLTRHAPDAHVVLLRVALQTGIALDALRAPERLSEDDRRRLEASVRRILGFEQPAP